MSEDMKQGKDQQSARDVSENCKRGSSLVYIRENSVNETKEQYSPVTDEYQSQNGELAEKQAAVTDVKIKPVKIMMYERQTSSCPFVKQADKTFLGPVMTYKSNDRKLSEDYEDPLMNKFRRLKKCVFCMSACGFCMFTLAILLFIFLVLMTTPHSRDLAYTDQDPQSFTRAHTKTSGNFIVDQDKVLESSDIRWLPDQYSIIEVVPNTNCVKITLNGDYFVTSRFTFKVPITEERTLFTHNLKVLAEDKNENMFMRQYVNIPDDRVSEYRTTSVFTKIFHLRAGEQICLFVSKPKLLYASGIDNDLTIVRLNDDIKDLP